MSSKQPSVLDDSPRLPEVLFTSENVADGDDSNNPDADSNVSSTLSFGIEPDNAANLTEAEISNRGIDDSVGMTVQTSYTSSLEESAVSNDKTENYKTTNEWELTKAEEEELLALSDASLGSVDDIGPDETILNDSDDDDDVSNVSRLIDDSHSSGDSTFEHSVFDVPESNDEDTEEIQIPSRVDGNETNMSTLGDEVPEKVSYCSTLMYLTFRWEWPLRDL